MSKFTKWQLFLIKKPRNSLSEIICHFVNLLISPSSSFFLNLRKITWLNLQQPKTRGHVDHPKYIWKTVESQTVDWATFEMINFDPNGHNKQILKFSFISSLKSLGMLQNRTCSCVQLSGTFPFFVSIMPMTLGYAIGVLTHLSLRAISAFFILIWILREYSTEQWQLHISLGHFRQQPVVWHHFHWFSNRIFP